MVGAPDQTECPHRVQGCGGQYLRVCRIESGGEIMSNLHKIRFWTKVFSRNANNVSIEDFYRIFWSQYFLLNQNLCLISSVLNQQRFSLGAHFIQRYGPTNTHTAPTVRGF